MTAQTQHSTGGNPVDPIAAYLAAQREAAIDQHGRAEAKSWQQLAGTLGVLLVGVTAARDTTVAIPARIVGAVAVALALIAVVLLVRSVRPRLGGRYGLNRLTDADALLDHATTTAVDPHALHVELATDAASYAHLALDKYRHTRLSLDLLLAAGAAAVLAMTLAAVL